MKSINILILLLGLSACNPTQNSKEGEGVNNMAQTVSALNEHWNSLNLPKVSIDYPNKWTLDTSGVNGTLFILISQKVDSFDQFSATINLFTEPVGQARLSSYVDASEKAIQGFMQNSRLRKSKDTLIKGKSFHMVQFVAESEGRKLIFDQLYTIQNQQAYVLTYNCEEDEYDLMSPLATEVIRSFTLK